jgi:hypothetical protein
VITVGPLNINITPSAVIAAKSWVLPVINISVTHFDLASWINLDYVHVRYFTAVTA